jgi:ArsR family transcriptional regulator
MDMAEKLKPADFKLQAQVFKALAHSGRLLMVNELSRGERCVCELAALVGSEMPTVSRHLSQLKHAGIIADEKRGAQVFYRLRVPCVLKFFSCVEAVQKNGSGKG